MKYIVTLNGKNYEVEVTESEAVLLGVTDAAPAAPAPATATPAQPVPAASPAPAAAVSGGTNVVSPMPGTILSVSASAGQSVKAGDVIMVLEAMKMENDIVAPCDGVIKQVLVSKGSTVNTDDVLAVM